MSFELASSNSQTTIRRCETRSDFALFERLPELLHSDAPGFIPTFPGSVRKFFDPSGSFAKHHGQPEAYLAFRDGTPVGRVAAILNRTHNEFHGDRVGFFGFFACENNQQTANALLTAARAKLREHGCDCIRGPYNPSINEECGLLVEGFDLPPFVGTTWNPDYYEGLLTNFGFRRVREMVSLLLDLTKPIPERVAKIARRIRSRNTAKIRNIDLRRLPEDLEILRHLYNRTLDRNWGFVPLCYDDLAASAADFRAIADPELMFFLEVDGYPAAFAVSLPNYHEVLRSCLRIPYRFRFPALLWKTFFHSYRSTRLAILGVDPDYRDRGLSGVLMFEQMWRTAKKYRETEISWVESNNTEIIENSHLMGAELARKYGIFQAPTA